MATIIDTIAILFAYAYFSNWFDPEMLKPESANLNFIRTIVLMQIISIEMFFIFSVRSDDVITLKEFLSNKILLSFQLCF